MLIVRAYKVFLSKEDNSVDVLTFETGEEAEEVIAPRMSSKEINIAHGLYVFGDASPYKSIEHPPLSEIRE